MTRLDDLTRDDIDLMRNALGVWADSIRWRYGDVAFCNRLAEVSDKLWDITYGTKG